MKNLKKAFAFTLVLILLISINVPAFAADAEGDNPTTDNPIYTDMTSITIRKDYKLIGAGSSPAETFTLEQSGSGRVIDGDAQSAPALGAITGAVFEEGAAADPAASGTITVTLPQYDSVGIYEYTLIEKNGTTAGVAYYGDAIKLVVTVINGDDGKLRVAAVHTESEGADKSDTFENTYSAGTLKISKTVTGNMGDKNKYFEFTVLLSGRSGMTYPETFAVSGGSYAQNPKTIKLSEETTFMLKHGDTISIANLPYDVDYMVIEMAADGYTTTSTNETGRISAAEQTAAFTNVKNSAVDTGVMLDSLPYVLMLAAVLGGAAVMVVRRRRGAED